MSHFDGQRHWSTKTPWGERLLNDAEVDANTKLVLDQQRDEEARLWKVAFEALAAKHGEDAAVFLVEIKRQLAVADKLMEE